MDPDKMDQEMQAQMKKLGIQLNNDKISDSDIDGVLKEVYGELGQEIPKESKKPASVIPAVEVAAKEESPKEIANRLQESKTQFLEGQKFGALAVQYDEDRSYGFAAFNYDKALECFARSLSLGFPRDESRRKSLVETMESYLDRIQVFSLKAGDPTLTLKECTKQVVATNQLSTNRRMVLTEMSKEGVQILSRGMRLRQKAAGLIEESNDGETITPRKKFWAFILYKESLDCFVTFMDNEKIKLKLLSEAEEIKKKKDAIAKVMKVVMEVLDKAEELKQQL